MTSILRTAVPIAVLLVVTVGCRSRATAEPGHPLTVKVQAGIAGGEGSFSHASFTKLLKKHVRASGRVDYAALKADRGALLTYLKTLEDADLAQLGKAELEALLINAYNGYTLELMTRHYPLKSIRDLDEPWDTDFCNVGGELVSLNFIENKLLRVRELFDDPRIHFGVNCASMGCPPLRAEAYEGATLDAQLDDSLRTALAKPAYLVVDGDTVRTTKIFKWFKADFQGKHGGVAAFVARYAPEPAAKILRDRGDAALSYLDYDWGINDIESK